MTVSSIEDILILAKTYPSPSAKYTETTCVAGINRSGQMRRLYPVPYRLINNEQQFKKWQWVKARVYKSNTDHRPESYKIYVDTIQRIGEPISTDNGWQGRWEWIDRIPTNTDNNQTLYLIKPKRLLGLDIEPEKNPHWTQEELDKLLQEQQQGQLNMFEEETEKREIRRLRKMPYHFYYRYTLDTPQGEVAYRHKIIDWEAGALYWNCHRRHGKNWEESFRDKIEQKLPAGELMLLMGNIHRFQDKWLIISLIYPLRRPEPPTIMQQLTMF